MEKGNIWFALGLTIFAGLSTGIGGIIVLFFKKTNAKVLSVALGFSAGVMIYVSFAELYVESKRLLVEGRGQETGEWLNILSFFAGILLIAVIDKLVPSYKNPHEAHSMKEVKNYCDRESDLKLLRVGLFTAVAIAVHNFPEGMATFVSAMQQPRLGMAIALAIAIHNIPEGIAVAIPVYCATGSRKKAMAWSVGSGLAEPLGAMIAYSVFYRILNEMVFGVLFAAVAGIMVFISLDELLPTAREYGEHHLSIYGLIAGMIIMAVSLVVLI